MRTALAGALLFLAVLVGAATHLVADEAADTALLEKLAALDPPPAGDLEALTVDRPLEGAVFPPEMVAPTFLWHDPSAADAWYVRVVFADGGAPLHALADGAPPPERAIDPECIGPTNEIYRPQPPAGSAPVRAWTPPADIWAEIKRRSAESPATVAFYGLASAAPTSLLASGTVRISTSKDPVGAPIFYRDVPLMPAEGAKGTIKPLARGAIPLIAWRLRDISRPESKVVLRGMPTCANCHSFSADGSTLAMDVDGPQGDKGAYAIAPTAEEVVIDDEHVITWNSFTEKPEGHKTIGFLSRVSPDGTFAITTLNESLYVANFTNYKFLQVFYPTRGILAWYSTKTGAMKALPGADDPEYVHCNGVWTPDGKEIVFSRAKAFDPYVPGLELAARPNDPNEPPIQYDLYRMPFADGEGGTPVPIEGASDNGMSNTFPKVSPDGKWIVFTKCRNGQLMRPDGKLWIVPLAGGEAREMRCNSSLMNSWHSFSPNGRWLVFSSKVDTPYTQMYLTHIDEDGNDSPRVLIPNSTAANRAVNIPEFVNLPYDGLSRITAPAVNHHRHLWDALDLLETGSYAEAIPHLEKALAADPEFVRALVAYGLALTETGSPEKALVPLERALDVDPRSAGAHHNLGLVRSRLDQFPDAEKAYRAALDLNPNRALTWNNLGFVLAEMRREEEAIRCYQEALERDRGLALAWKNLGRVLLRKGDRRAALGHYLEAAVHDPNDPGTHRAIAGLLMRLGDIPVAIEHLARTIELAPEDGGAHLQLAWLLATTPDDELRDGARAVELAERAHELLPKERTGPLDVLAAAYAEAGRFEDAVKTGQEALQLVRAGTPAEAPGLADRVRGYEEGRPYRAPSRKP